MTFGVLNSAPKRFTLTNLEDFAISHHDAVLQRNNAHSASQRIPLQQPQPRQPRSKIQQLTGYDLDVYPSPLVAEASIRTDSVLSTGSDGSSYSPLSPVVQTMRTQTEEWGNWTPVDYSPARREPTDSLYGSRAYSMSSTEVTTSVVEIAEHIPQHEDRSYKSNNVGQGNYIASQRHEQQTAKYEDVPSTSRSWRQFSFDSAFNDAPQPSVPLISNKISTSPQTFLPHGPEDLEYDRGYTQQALLDESTYYLEPLVLPQIPFATSAHRQEADNVSHFSSSSSDSGGVISNARDTVRSGIRTIATPFKLPNRPSSIFRDRRFKPASIRVPSPEPSVSVHGFGKFSSGNHPLKSPFPFKISASAEVELEEDDDEETFAHRLSAAFRSLSSKAVSPLSPTRDIISTRVIHTSARRKNGPDTPFPTKLTRRNSYGGKLKGIGEDVKDNVKEGGKVVWGKMKDVREVVGDIAGGKARFEEKKDDRRREKLLQSIRVVREKEEIVHAHGNMRLGSLNDAKDRLDLWV